MRTAVSEPLETRLLLTSYYVDAISTNPTTGLSWQTAFRDLQTALATVGTGDIIRVAQGTYRPTEGSDRTAMFIISSQLQLQVYGSYAGLKALNQGLDPNVRRFEQTPSILSGDINQQNYLFDNSYHVVYLGFDLKNSPTVLDGFKIRYGCADQTNGLHGYGAGIFVSDDSYAVVRYCSIEDNFAHIDGGGVFITGASQPTFLNCNISTNFGNVYGGGMYIQDSWALIDCSTFTCNQSFKGGAIFVDNSELVIFNTILWGNLVSSGNGTTSFDFLNMDSTPYGTVEYSDIDQIWPGTNVSNINADPKFQTMPGPGSGGWGTGDETLGNLRLRSESPLINRGSDALIDGSLTTDLSNLPRVVGSNVDIGAYERSAATTVSGTAGTDHIKHVDIFKRSAVGNDWSSTLEKTIDVGLLGNLADDVAVSVI